MISLKRYLWFGFLGALPIFGTGMAKAQKNEDIPTPPYVATIPDYLQWTITVSAEGGTDKPAVPQRDAAGKVIVEPPEVQRVILTKTKDTQRNVLVYTNGKTSEVWYYKNFVMTVSARREYFIDTVGSLNAGYIDTGLSAKGFFGVDWITGTDFQSKKKLTNGVDVYVYSNVPGNSATANAQPPATGDATEAMIAVDSRLPMLVRKGGKVYTYTYLTPPTQMLELPPDLGKEIADVEAKVSLIQRMKDLSHH